MTPTPEQRETARQWLYDHGSYHAVLLTPLAELLAAERAKAIEEAVEIADRHKAPSPDSDYVLGADDTACAIAEELSALIPAPPTEKDG